MAPQPFPGWTFPPGPPPPPPALGVVATSLPPFPFGPSSSNGDGPYPMWNMEQRRLPLTASQFPPPNPNGAPDVALLPPPLPLPPLVPDRLHPIMPRPNATTAADRLSISTDASEVLDMLGDLGDKVVQMGFKVDQMQLEEKKHYYSLRRGLKRLKDKEDKPGESPEIAGGVEDLSLRTRGSVERESAGLTENGESPYCICNYCIQRKSLLSSTLTRRQCGHVCYVRYLRGFYLVR